MKALRYRQYGDHSQLKIETIPKPAPARGEVLVKVAAAGVNPVDYKMLAGWLNLVIPGGWPKPLGFDVAGEVEETGPGCNRVKKGDLVWGMTHFRGVGSFAEYVCLPERFVTAKPANMTLEEAASIPLAGLTSYQSLVTFGGLRSGQRVLILGGAGGTGFIAVQIAKALGAHVTATASERNKAFVSQLGTDKVVDYTKGNVAEAVLAEGGKFDLVYDTVGGYESWQLAHAVLKPRGHYVTIVGDRPAKLDAWKLLRTGASIANRKFWGILGYPKYDLVTCDNSRIDQLDILRDFAEQGKLRAVVEQAFPLEQGAQAIERMRSGKVVGKIVIQPQKSN